MTKTWNGLENGLADTSFKHGFFNCKCSVYHFNTHIHHNTGLRLVYERGYKASSKQYEVLRLKLNKVLR